VLSVWYSFIRGCDSKATKTLLFVPRHHLLRINVIFAVYNTKGPTDIGFCWYCQYFLAWHKYRYCWYQ